MYIWWHSKNVAGSIRCLQILWKSIFHLFKLKDLTNYQINIETTTPLEVVNFNFLGHQLLILDLPILKIYIWPNFLPNFVIFFPQIKNNFHTSNPLMQIQWIQRHLMDISRGAVFATNSHNACGQKQLHKSLPGQILNSRQAIVQHYGGEVHQRWLWYRKL